LRLTQKLKKFLKMASSFVQVIAEIGRFARNKSIVSISTSSSLAMLAVLAIAKKLSRTRR